MTGSLYCRAYQTKTGNRPYQNLQSIDRVRLRGGSRRASPGLAKRPSSRKQPPKRAKEGTVNIVRLNQWHVKHSVARGGNVLTQVTGMREKAEKGLDRVGLDRVGLAVAGSEGQVAAVEINQVRLQVSQTHDLPDGEVAGGEKAYKVRQIAFVFFTSAVAVVAGGHVDGFKVGKPGVQVEWVVLSSKRHLPPCGESVPRVLEVPVDENYMRGG
jgi:hypothetical protein